MPTGVYERKPRPHKQKVGYIDDKGVGHIPLTRNMWALCDAHWFHNLSQFCWVADLGANGRWYARGRVGNKHVRMQRFIMGVTDPKIYVDHKEREATLDNREENLRISTPSQNKSNQGVRKDSRSRLKGAWRPEHGSITFDIGQV
jgi:hypothetical protein